MVAVSQGFIDQPKRGRHCVMLGRDHMKLVTISIFVVAFTAVPLTAALGSSSDKWAELMQRASAACIKASELKKAKAGGSVDFSDKVLVMVDGIWPQPHMKNAPARFACLYDKRTQKAEAVEAVR